MMMPHRRLLVVAGVAVLACQSCALLPPPRTEPAAPAREMIVPAMLHGKRLDLHVAVPLHPSHGDLLVLYASGDGGWFGAAIDQWRQIARAGFISVGFSSRSFLRIDRPSGEALSPARLSAEYAALIHDVQQQLGGDAPPRVILAGWSRGASLAVLAGTESTLDQSLAGVLAIGLAEGEDLAVDSDDDDSDDGAATGPQQWPFDNYQRLLELRVPCAVIQATRDKYFPATQARRRFGADAATRRLYAVEAGNHRFSGGAQAFTSALGDALDWLSAITTKSAA